MIDVSQVTNYDVILLCVFGAILLIGFLKGILGGFWKSVIKLALWIVLIVLIVKFAPVLGTQLATTGILEKLVSMIGDTAIVEFVLGLISETLYISLASSAMLIVGAIIIGLVSMITKSIFKKKRFISRLIAAIFSTAFNAVIVTVLFIVASSPLLFKGAQEHINNNEYLVMYQDNIVVPIQGLLSQKEIPSSVEEITLVALNQEATKDNVEKLGKTIDLLSNPEESLASIVVKDGEGNITGIDQVKATELYSDLVFTLKIVNDLENADAKQALGLILQGTLEENLSGLIYEGHAVVTVTVNATDYDNMNVYMSNLGFTSTLENTINSIFVK